jgi:acyl-CoA thioester hydrolase
MGIVYYANYLVWFEVARSDWLRHQGWSYRDMETEGFSLPVLEVQCMYRQPARYDDDLEVKAIGQLLSPVRVEFAYEIVRLEDTAILATGRTVHAAVDRDGRPCRLPERIRSLFCQQPTTPPTRNRGGGKGADASADRRQRAIN